MVRILIFVAILAPLLAAAVEMEEFDLDGLEETTGGENILSAHETASAAWPVVFPVLTLILLMEGARSWRKE